MEWIHCNMCYSRPGNTAVSFELTNCGHFVCSQCRIKTNSTDICPICNKTCIGVALAHPLPPSVEMCLTNPVITLKRVRQVFNFQESNRQKLYSHSLKQMELTLAQKEKKWEQLHKENCYLKAILSQQGLPPPTTVTPRLPHQVLPGSQQYQITLQTPQSLGLR